MSLTFRKATTTKKSEYLDTENRLVRGCQRPEVGGGRNGGKRSKGTISSYK